LADLTLVVRRTLRAPAERVFAAWTTPELLMKWWGPADVTCTAAEVDLRAGGAYRIANRFPDGRVFWISGEFEVVEPPHRLVYTWRFADSKATERVTVRFDAVPGGTEVVVTHERIGADSAREHHEAGWQGCLDGLAALLGE
jgi:glutathione S-transferase